MGYSRAIRYAAAFAAVCVATPATASDWRLVVEFGNGVKAEVDYETIEYTNSGFTAWIRSTDAGPNPRQTVMRASIDCRARTIQVRHYMNYDSTGRSLGGGDYPAPRVELIVPDSLDDSVRQRLCAVQGLFRPRQ